MNDQVLPRPPKYRLGQIVKVTIKVEVNGETLLKEAMGWVRGIHAHWDIGNNCDYYYEVWEGFPSGAHLRQEFVDHKWPFAERHVFDAGDLLTDLAWWRAREREGGRA